MAKVLCLFIIVLFTAASTQGANEFNLKKKLLANYIKTVRPVKNFSDSVQVRFDIALRTVVDLDEKKQMLTTSTWIRIYWDDANLVWDPKNYSDIKTINFRPSDIWTPDVVLYNSADSSGRGILDTAMKTNIIVDSSGSCRWFCPLVLETECSVDIEWFPFDKQICPFKFGLWTYDGLRVNFSIVNEKADVSSYIPNGEWNLHGTKGKRKEVFYTCCPTTPYPVIDYEVTIIRRTKFYIINLIWPGILIAVLASITFLLPPECGERIGLGITNLLAMTVFLLLISESIPPTSDAVPLASKFFSAILGLSALALVESCIVIKFLHKTQEDVTHVPYFIKKIVNVYLARLLCIKSETSDKNSFDLHRKSSKGIENPTMNGNSRNEIALQQRQSSKKASQGKEESHVVHPPSAIEMNLAAGMDEIVSVIRRQENEDEYKAEWRKAIHVVDRLFTVLFLLALAGSCVGLFVSSPRFFVP